MFPKSPHVLEAWSPAAYYWEGPGGRKHGIRESRCSSGHRTCGTSPFTDTIYDSQLTDSHVTRYSPRKWVYIKRDIGDHDPAPFSLTAICKPESLDEVLCCETSPIHSCHMGLSSEPWPCSQSLVLGSELSLESPPCCCLSVCPSMALKTLLINSSIPSNLS